MNIKLLGMKLEKAINDQMQDIVEVYNAINAIPSDNLVAKNILIGWCVDKYESIKAMDTFIRFSSPEVIPMLDMMEKYNRKK